MLPDPDVVVVGGANIDYLIKGRALPRPGATAVGDQLHEAPGGKGANQAIACARLGARVAFVARVGDDERGRVIRDRLREENIDDAGCTTDANAATGVALIMVDAAGEKMIMTAPGANLRLEPHHVLDVSRLVSAAKILLVQLEPPLATVLAAIRVARDAGARVVLDAAPPAELPPELLQRVDVLRANADEATAITGVTVRDVDSARMAAHALLRGGVGAACIACPGGDLLVEPSDEAWLPHLSGEVVDATGAGDAFAAGIAVGLAERRSLLDAARFGRAASALKTRRIGAQTGLPRRADVDALLSTP